MKPEPKLTVVPKQKLTEDRRTDALDKALNAAEKELLPLLLHESASNTFADFLQAIHTHLKIELNYIRTGKGLDDPAGSPTLQALRERFLALKTGGAAVITFTVTAREFDTIVAALRLWQQDSAHIADQDGMLADISEEHGDALSKQEIDNLIERVN